MEKFVTDQPTDFPIGESGFFLKSKIGELSVLSVEQIKGSLYKVNLYGLMTDHSDEFSIGSKTYNDSIVLDMDDQELITGYALQMNDFLFVIFDVPSIDVGWPAEDTVTIKNLLTKKRITISSKTPLEDGEIKEDGNLFVFEGELWEQKNDTGNVINTKKWRAFINDEGRVVYQGFCWEYSNSQKGLLIKRSRTSKKRILFD